MYIWVVPFILVALQGIMLEKNERGGRGVVYNNALDWNAGAPGSSVHRLRSRQTHHVGKNVRIRAHRR